MSWWGQLQRMENVRTVKKVWEANIQKKKRKEDHDTHGIKHSKT